MNGEDYKRHHDQVDIEMEEKGEERTHGQKHREEHGERRIHSQRHGEEPTDELRTHSQRHGEEPGERRTHSQRYPHREEPAGEPRTESQRHPHREEPAGELRTQSQRHREEPMGERRAQSQRHREEPAGERRAQSQRHREEPAGEPRTEGQRHREEPAGERRAQSQRHREEPADERRAQSQRHWEEHGERRTQSQKYREEEDEPIQTRKHGLDIEVKRCRSRSKSPRPAHHDDWKSPSGSMKNGEYERKRDSTKSGDQRHRRLSDDGDAYHLIREASYRKDPRRASEPAAIKPRYPPPPALETYPTQPRSFLWLAMLTAIVNIVFGIIALVCAITSDNAWAAGRREEAKKRGLYALGFCIVGIVCTAIIIIAVPVSYKYLRI